MGKTYRKAYRPPLPKRSRRIPVKGTGDDADRYYKCWNCGFICDSQRDELGGSDDGSGVGHIEALELSSEDEAKLKSCLGGDINCYQVGMELDASSTAKQVLHNFKSDISSGCPFCGSKNYRGDY